MPKRKTYNFKSLQGSSSSSSNPNPSGQNGQEGSTASVNERLHDLRKLEAKDAEARKRQLAEAVNQRSVPPDLGGILGFSESVPPKPKTNVRTTTIRDRRRVPGPAPPKSWLAGAGSGVSGAPTSRGKARQGAAADVSLRSKPKHLLRFARLSGLEDDSAVETTPPTLVHLALKSIADSWDFLDEDDYPMLTEVPLRLRLRLLSYISFSGCSMTTAGLHALLQGNENVSSLDLAGLVGQRNLTLKRISNLLEPGHTFLARKDTVDNLIAESWDIADSLDATLTVSPTTNRFSTLTHLCLSHPAPTVSWRDLLSFSKHTPQTTHLSLAYWPRPTLTPNLSTSTVSSRHGPEVTAGGSHYYSTVDQDLSEPASLLRQLSHNLLCLQWLDLEGCEEWIPALGKLATPAHEIVGTDGWATTSQPGPSIFTSNWKNLNHIRCTQGWLPSYGGIISLAERSQSTVIDVLLVEGVTKYLSNTQNADGEWKLLNPLAIETERKKARVWLEREYRTTYASMQINSSRRAQGLRPVEVDFGWIRRHSSSIT